MMVLMLCRNPGPQQAPGRRPPSHSPPVAPLPVDGCSTHPTPPSQSGFQPLCAAPEQGTALFWHWSSEAEYKGIGNPIASVLVYRGDFGAQMVSLDCMYVTPCRLSALLSQLYHFHLKNLFSQSSLSEKEIGLAEELC